MGVFFVVHGLKKQGFAALVFRGTNVSEAVCHEVFFPSSISSFSQRGCEGVQEGC